jgi:hypothetical protein
MEVAAASNRLPDEIRAMRCADFLALSAKINDRRNQRMEWEAALANKSLE